MFSKRSWILLCLVGVSSVAIADAVLSSLGTVKIPGGVTHSSVKDQKSGEICWSYTLAAMAEATYRKVALEKLARSRADHRLSADELTAARKALETDPAYNKYPWTVRVAPEYMQFWHIYYQIEKHLSKFRLDARALIADAADKATDAEKQLVSDTLAAYGGVPGKKPDTDKLYQPDVGNIEGTALKEVKLFGLAPNAYFHADMAFQTDDEETAFEEAIPQFVGDKILALADRGKAGYADEVRANLAKYAISAGEININLYSDMNAYFHDILGLTKIGKDMPLPNTEITYDKAPYTPLEFMSDYLGFKPNIYESFITTPANQQLALRAVATAMEQDDVIVPIGIAILDDTDPKYTPPTGAAGDLQARAEADGIFTTDFCPEKAPGDRECSNDSGGHEISGVNYIEAADGSVSGVIIKNSWGKMPHTRNADGEIDGTANDGYFILTADYLKQTAVNVNDAWDFVIPKRIANRPEFKGQFKTE